MKGKRVTIYARFSTDKQSDASVEDQVHRAGEWLRVQGADPDAAQVLSDRAVSGASMDRPGMRALMAAVEGGQVDVIVTESVDRISRDAADAFAFRKALAYRGIALECLDGTRIASDDKNGLLMFGLRSMLGEQYLVDLADKTRRGLEGRARAGKATGGAAYGFRNVNTPQGSDIEVVSEQAAIVRRMFAMYASGHSFAAIAAALNAEGVPPPRAHARRTGHGWMHTAVRDMLLNERYRGVWTYGAREWRKVPGTNRKLPRVRAGGPLVRRELPELAIIDAELWSAVQRRFEGRSIMPGRKRAFMLSGILHCAMCGGRMQFSGGATDRAYFGCSSARSRGTCENRRTVRIAAVEELVLTRTRAELASCVDEVREIIVEEIRDWNSSRPQALAGLRQEQQSLERQLANLVDVLAGTGSPTIAAKVRDLEARAVAVRADLAQGAALAPVLPSPMEIERRVLVLGAIADNPPDVAREALRRLVLDGRVECRPEPDRSFSLNWYVLPGVLFAAQSNKATPGAQGWPLLEELGCGGALPRLSNALARSCVARVPPGARGRTVG